MCDLDGCGAHKDMPPIVVPDEQRRAFLKGLAVLPLAAVLFDPTLARAQADTLKMVSIEAVVATKDDAPSLGVMEGLAANAACNAVDAPSPVEAK